ncbi:MAG TPA: energy transducer TonB [Thermoanaerobaculia bacterium]|nr:energy transducer TonB [Thermoanaerobaculia bacterium]
MFSLVLHSALIVWFIRSVRPVPTATNVPIARYVQLIKDNPKFVEAPGQKLEKKPSLSAPLSDGNRKASTPHPTGDTPTKRPGDGSGLYTPPMADPAPRVPRQQPRPAINQPATAPSASAQAAAAPPSASPGDTIQPDPSRLTYHVQSQTAAASIASGVDWRNAIRDIGRAEARSGDGVDLRNAGGGEKGFAEQGPLSFETQWYDWGDYAQSMVSKIRVHWYSNMPQLIRTGMQGVVTIRFTIERNGRITNIEILEGSGIPPYDYAARKALEQASPLNPLPKDFPNPNERVTAMFFYNMDPDKAGK